MENEIFSETTQTSEETTSGTQTVDKTEKRLQDKDNFINTLKTELEQLRAELIKKDIKNNVLEELRNTLKPSTKTEETQSPVLSEDKIRDLVKSSIEETEGNKIRTSNTNIVQVGLTNYFGSVDKAKDAVIKAAAELNVSVESLKRMGEQSPAALFKILGVDTKPGNSVQDVTKSVINTEAKTHRVPGNPGTREYFSQQRKENPSYFWSVKGQKEYHAAVSKDPSLLN